MFIFVYKLFKKEMSTQTQKNGGEERKMRELDCLEIADERERDSGKGGETGCVREVWETNYYFEREEKVQFYAIF